MSATRDLTLEEFQALVKACTGQQGGRDRAYLLLAVCTGFRVSEMLSLKRRHVVDYRGGVMKTVALERRFIKKKKKGRMAPVSPELKRVLAAWLLELERTGFPLAEDPLFPNPETRRSLTPSAIWKMIRRRAMQARISVDRLGTHSMRKTLTAAAMLEWIKRGDVQYLQKLQALLGHSEITSTMNYVKSLSAAEQMEGFNFVNRFAFGGAE